MSGMPNLMSNDQVMDALGEIITDLPSRRPASHHIGELRLMAAVLEDAVNILRKRPRSRAGREAREWVGSKDTNWPFSYERICEALNLDADSIRREITGTRPTARVQMPIFDLGEVATA